jgi:hypothetical protein
MKKLNIILPAIESESGLLRKNVSSLLALLQDAEISNYSLYIIFQTGTPGKDIFPSPCPPQVKVCSVSFFSTSKARNLGLSMVNLNSENYIYFLDCDTVPSRSFLEMWKHVTNNGIPFSCGSVRWGESEMDPPLSLQQEDSMEGSPKPTWKIMQHFLWTYIIRGDLIGNVRFNEQIGPGRETVLKSGEDMLFFYGVIKANRVSNIIEFPRSIVYHPKRPADLSKELTYAKGQGALYRYLLCEMKLPWNACFGVGILFFLFIGNAFFRAITFRHNGFKILKNRLLGVLSRKLQVYYIQSTM